MKARPLTLTDVTCIGVNAIVGTSIFLFPGRLAALLGPASILSFGLTALLLLPVALCFAEAASGFDGAGGPYLYARAAFGSWPGYAIGWLCWITILFSWAAVANGVAVYLGHFGPRFSTPFVVKAVAAVVIVAMGAINYRGVKLGAWTSNFFTAAKLLPLAVFVIAALPQAEPARFFPLAPHGWAPLGSACFLAYFAFQGFETVPVPAGEVDDAKRNVPRAVVIAMSGAAVLYMLIQAAAIGVHPNLAGSERPLADAAKVAIGGWGAGMIVAGAVFSTIGFNAGCALGGPRYLVALSEHGDLPPALAAPHPRFQTPSAAVLATTGFALLAALVLDFNKLVDISNVVVCAQYIATCAAIPLLRRQGREAGYRVPGGAYLLPAFGILSTLWLGSQGGFAQVGWSLGILALGILVKLRARALFRARSAPAIQA